MSIYPTDFPSPTSLQAALDTLAQGEKLHIVAGTYQVSATKVETQGVKIIGDGIVIFQNLRNSSGDLENCIELLADGTGVENIIFVVPTARDYDDKNLPRFTVLIPTT